MYNNKNRIDNFMHLTQRKTALKRSCWSSSLAPLSQTLLRPHRSSHASGTLDVLTLPTQCQFRNKSPFLLYIEFLQVLQYRKHSIKILEVDMFTSNLNGIRV